MPTRPPDPPLTEVESLPRASTARLEAHVRALEGERHPRSSPEALAAAAHYVESHLREAGLDPVREPFEFQGRTHENVVARKVGEDPDAPRVLIGAHYDTVRGTPGADDNASGVAVLLEAARILAPERLRATLELVGFNLEEQQVHIYRVGSRRYAAEARRRGVRYAGALILEMVGYTDPRTGAQRVPLLARWKRIPRTADFIVATGDGRSRKLARLFRDAAGDVAPGLPVVTFRSPLRGWLVWQTRLSDNASFWSERYQAIMITDTAFLRNPNYHRLSDRAATLDFAFMARVADATVETARRLAGVG